MHDFDGEEGHVSGQAEAEVVQQVVTVVLDHTVAQLLSQPVVIRHCRQVVDCADEESSWNVQLF